MLPPKIDSFVHITSVGKKIVFKHAYFFFCKKQTTQSRGNQPINEWVERRRRRQCDEPVTRIDAEILVKISRDNIPAGRRFPGLRKEYGAT